MDKTNELLGEIVHLASAAMLADDPRVKLSAVADIAAVVASLMRRHKETV